jgi:hypothetical protein
MSIAIDACWVVVVVVVCIKGASRTRAEYRKGEAAKPAAAQSFSARWVGPYRCSGNVGNVGSVDAGG